MVRPRDQLAFDRGGFAAMKILIFTPALKASAIGRMTSRVVHQLIDLGHKISVVRSEDVRLLGYVTHDFGVAPVAWNDEDTVNRLVSEADFIVYQIGDNFDFHRGCLEWLAQAPGIICLHDFFVAHLFFGWASNNLAQASQVLERWYGPKASSAFFRAASSVDFIKETHQSMPMTEWVCAMATGVVTHSQWGMPRVKASCRGPVHVVPLAYDIGDALDPENDAAEASNETAIKVLTVGHINPNKRVASVIKAIGSSPFLRKRCSYQLVGLIQAHVTHELAASARNANIRLRIHGEVDSGKLAQKFQSADIVCCLRWPSLEAASASAIEAMMHGKAVVVTDTGFYSELPDDCVVKIDPMDEVASLRAALERLSSDASLRQSLGARARAWSTNTFTAENYAQQLEKIGKTAATSAPLVGALRYFAGVLEGWGAGGIDMSELLQPLQLVKGPVSH